MTAAVEETSGVEAGVLGPLARLVLVLILPADRRDEFEGDLIEEAETIVLPRSSRKNALCWYWWQIVASAPAMIALRLKKEVGMYPKRWFVPAAVFVIWGLWGLVDMGNSPNGGFDWSNSVVLAVEPGGPADQAGLLEGDRIVSMDGVPADDLGTLRRQLRTEVGDTRALVVERTNVATGLTTTENIEITYSRLPGSERTMNVVAGVIGIVFLLSGMVVFVRAPTTPSLLFAIVGFAAMLLPSPYIGSYGLRILAMNLFLLVFLTGFASLLHLMLVFPRRKKVMEIKNAGRLIYLPVLVFILLGIVNFTVGLPSYIPTALILGLIFVGYLALSLFALIHSFMTAPPQERAEKGMNFMLAGVVVGLVPLACMMVAGMFVRTDLIPGTDYLFLTPALIPVSFAAALLKGTRVSMRPSAPQPT